MSRILDIHILRNTTVFTLLKRGLKSSFILEEKKVPQPYRISNKEETARIIHGFKEQYDITGVRVYLPLYMCLFSIIDLPLRKKSDIRNALLFELNDVLPLPLAEYTYDFQVIDRTKSSSRVLALCVKKDFISAIVSAVKETDTSIKSVRCDFMEQLSIVYSDRKRSDFMFVNCEEGDIDLALVKGGVCAEIRRMRDLSSLRSEIDSVRSAQQIKDVILSGDITDEIRTHTGVSAFSRQKEKRTGLWNTPYTLDLFDPALSADYRKQFKRYAYTAMIVSVILISAGFFLPVYRDYSQLNTINGQIREIKDEASGLIGKRKQLDVDRKKLKFLLKRKVRSTLYLQLMTELSVILPKDAWVMSLDANEKGLVELKGFSDDPSRLVEIIENSDMFKNVVFSSPIIRSGEKTRFSVKMELEI